MVTAIKNITPFIVKARDHYTCIQCGSTETVQAHHRIPGDDSTMTTLCADCHSKEHPDIPRAFFFVKNHQPYWYNKSAASLAREWGVCSRTVIRAAKALDIPMGELFAWDEELMRIHVLSHRKQQTKKPRTPKKRSRVNMDSSICSNCGSRHINKAGRVKWFCDGRKYWRQRFRCQDCGLSVTAGPKHQWKDGGRQQQLNNG